MEAPFGRGRPLPRTVRSKRMAMMSSGCIVVVGHAGRRDQETFAVPEADVAGGPLVDAERVHRAAGVDDALAFLSRRRTTWRAPSIPAARRAGSGSRASSLGVAAPHRQARRRRRTGKRPAAFRRPDRLTGFRPFASKAGVIEARTGGDSRFSGSVKQDIEGAPMAIAFRIAALALGASAGRFSPDARRSRRRAPVVAAPAISPDQLVGKWGFAAYHRDTDRARTIKEARAQCNKPYVIGKGPNGGVMMNLADQATCRNWCSRPARTERPISGRPAPPATADDRIVTNVEANSFTHELGRPRQRGALWHVGVRALRPEEGEGAATFSSTWSEHERSKGFPGAGRRPRRSPRRRRSCPACSRPPSRST